MIYNILLPLIKIENNICYAEEYNPMSLNVKDYYDLKQLWLFYID